MDPALSVIIVHFNTKQFLASCLESLVGQAAEIHAEVFVIDNDSSDGTIETLAPQFPMVRFVAAGANLGFAAANNRGIALARGAFVLFLNPDTILSEGSLDKCLLRMRSDPTIGALGCRTTNPDGSHQPSARSLPTVWSVAIESLGLRRLLPYGPWWGDPWIEDSAREQEVGVVKGAFLLTRRNVIAKVGGFDERFFLYSEEQDWCKRVIDAGWKVLYYPGASIIHSEGSSSPVRRHSARFLIYDSETEYFRKHYGWSSAVLVRAFMFIGALLRAVAWSISSGLGIHPVRREKARYYWLVVLWFLEGVVGARPAQSHFRRGGKK